MGSTAAELAVKGGAAAIGAAELGAVIETGRQGQDIGNLAGHVGRLISPPDDAGFTAPPPTPTRR